MHLGAEKVLIALKGDLEFAVATFESHDLEPSVSSQGNCIGDHILQHLQVKFLSHLHLLYFHHLIEQFQHVMLKRLSPFVLLSHDLISHGWILGSIGVGHQIDH